MTKVLNNNAAAELIAKMYLNEDLADVHFKFNIDDDVQHVPAHKLILATLSPVFNTMFFGSLKEGSVVKIADADADAFKEFLQFFYLGEVTLSIENIETVVRLADKYDVIEYVNACSIFLKSQLTLDNMCWGYQLAVSLENKDFIECCEDKIIRSPKEIFATDGFQRCDESILKRILELDLMCKEAIVFEACLSWARYACKQNDLDETQTENLKTRLGDCFKLIRFGTMKSEEFSAIAMANDGLFTPDEFKDVMFTLTAKEYKPRLFNPNHRQLMWNEKEVMLCHRLNTQQNIRYIQSPEVIWFTSNQMVLLGEFYSANTHNISCHLLNTTITVTEINNDSTQKVLYQGPSQTLNRLNGQFKVVLTQPIVIKPQNMYEIRLKVLNHRNECYYDGYQKTRVELGNGHTIQFHQNPSHMSYNTSTYGWIQTLGFNNI